MKILAFDTSTEALTVALSHGDRLWQHDGPGGPRASATLVPAVRTLLAEAGLRLSELDAIAFGRGPGSFTGLRTACAVAQGLAWGAGVPLLPVDTLLAVAEDARHRTGCTQVVAVLDARMDEVYAAGWTWSNGVWSAGFECGLFKPEALAVPAGWTVAGNAQAAYGDRLAPGALHAVAGPTAAAVLRLAPALIRAGGCIPAAQAAPFYVRDKVAKTTDERLADKQVAAAALEAAATAAAGGAPAA